MKRISTALVLMAALVTAVHAYNGRTTVTKASELEHDIRFDVTFQEHDGMLIVTVVAPQTAKTLSLSQFAVIQSENGKTTLRVPISSTQWEAVPDGKGQLKLEAKDMKRKVTFAVSQAKLLETKLEAVYGSGEQGWTFVVDLSTYQLKDKNSTTR